MLTVKKVNDYVVVRKGRETVCMAILGKDNRLHDIAFSNPNYQKCNRTRQAAMSALQQAGYR